MYYFYNNNRRTSNVNVTSIRSDKAHSTLIYANLVMINMYNRSKCVFYRKMGFFTYFALKEKRMYQEMVQKK